MPPRSAKANKVVELLAKAHGKEPSRNPGDTPLDHLVYGILSHGRTSTKARDAYNSLGEAFVDRNELRVAEIHEIVPALSGLGTADEVKATALLLRRTLQVLFDSLDRVRIEIESPEDADEVSQVLNSVPDLPPGIVAAVLARFMDEPPLKVNRSMVRTGTRLGLIPKTSSEAKQAKAVATLGGKAEGKALLAYVLTQHGETHCLDKAPLCTECVAASLCPAAKKK